MGKFFALIIILNSVAVTIKAQTVTPSIFNAAGGSYDTPSSYQRYEWSLGEMMLVHPMAPNDSAYLLTHGVLQPCTDKIPGSSTTLVFEAGDYKIFPNPTSGKVELDFFMNVTGQMNLRLVDGTGRKLEHRSYRYDGCCRIELFDLTRYPDAVYYIIADLKMEGIQSGQLRHGGFKIIKLSQK